MATFRVRDGYTLTHNGSIHEAGALVELSHDVANDMAVRGHVEAVDAAGNPIAAPAPDDLARFRTHERIGKLQEQLAAANDRVAAIKAKLATEEQVLEQEVAAAAAKRATEAQDKPGTEPADSKAPTKAPKKE